MKTISLFTFRIVCCVGFLHVAFTSDAARGQDSSPTTDAIKAAVARSLPLLEKGSRVSMEKRKQCFTCHNQGLPIMALITARERGFSIDTENLRKQVQFTADFLERNRTNYLAGNGQGGQALTAGYALWALENGGWKADATTDAVAEYLLLWQKDVDHWQPQTVRPPSEGSLFTASYVALRGLKKFGTAAQKERIAQRVEQVRQWVLKTPATDTEDSAFRLWTLWAVAASQDEIGRAEQALLQTQRADGGWAQLPDMETDAYATSTALVALRQAGGLATSNKAYRQGLRYLLATQLDDGSWHVVTRSKPIQTYYESGYPHEEDQFISISAAGWASTALALALPMTPEKKTSAHGQP
ncbi:MAG TPA: prenyltransferase/squalene oxidase repeat-containing protein [Candidatus Eisenbacteria bacterium]|jgi:hypothetical protein|nr:prenyltransferase/squalene oxidase repeat-containing protein [Candidatus Eisenbacteria bacterium]